MAEQVTKVLEIPAPKFVGNVLRNIQTPAAKQTQEQKQAIEEQLNQKADSKKFNSCMDEQASFWQNGVLLLKENNDIDNQKIHFNNMIKKLNGVKQRRDEELRNAYSDKFGGKSLAKGTDFALQEGWSAKITDVHGDLFSMLSAYVYAGAVYFVEGDFTYYNVVSGTYYTQDEYDKLSEDNKKYFYVMPTPHINPNFKGTLVNCGDFIDRGPESIQCICTAELLGQALGNQMVNIIGNHEVMLAQDTKLDDEYGYKYSSGLVKNIIQRGINAGYFNTCVVVDTGKLAQDGKPIYESYAHTMICKDHLQQMFKILGIFKDKIDDSFINDGYEKEYEQMKLIFSEQFKKLPEDLQAKINGCDFIESDKMYEVLQTARFEDIDFFRIKNIIGNSIFWFHNGFNQGGIIEIGYLDSICSGSMDWLFGERYLPYEKNIGNLFVNVNQFVGHDYGDFVVNVSNITRLDTLRSVGYRENESRCTIYISQLNSDKIILHEELLNRNGNVITDVSELQKSGLHYGISEKKIGEPNELYNSIVEGNNLKKKKNNSKKKEYQGKKNKLNAFLPLTEEHDIVKETEKNINVQIEEQNNQIQNKKCSEEYEKNKVYIKVYINNDGSIYLNETEKKKIEQIAKEILIEKSGQGEDEKCFYIENKENINGQIEEQNNQIQNKKCSEEYEKNKVYIKVYINNDGSIYLNETEKKKIEQIAKEILIEKSGQGEDEKCFYIENKENINVQIIEEQKNQIQILQQENAELKTALSKVQNEKSGQKAQVAEQELQVAEQELQVAKQRLQIAKQKEQIAKQKEQIAKQKEQISQTSQENRSSFQENRSSFLKSRVASAIEKSKQSLPNQTHNQATEIPLIPE